ncbi:hypothetical protein EI94DRAFT_1234225 [Lactarius quietus]|nr:hypothetical protein EI94DRAFT_1234225 [Lactarius quietus]
MYPGQIARHQCPFRIIVTAISTRRTLHNSASVSSVPEQTFADLSPQRQQQPQQLSSSPPRTRNNQYLDSNRISPPSHLQVSPTMSQMGPLYASQLPSASQHTRTRSSDPDISRLPVAQRPPPSPNRQDVSLRPTRTGNGEGTSDRWGYQPGGASSVSTPPRSSAPQPVVPNIVRQPPPRAPPPQAPQPVPRPPSFVTCLIPDCREQVVRDLRTNELTEYCGEAHMRFVVSSSSHVVWLYSYAELRPRPAPSEAIRRLGILVCPACNKFPRHTGSEYCGYSCEQWAVARERERQQRRQQEQQQQQQRQRQGQQQPQPQQPQQRQGQQPSSVANPYPVPNSGSVTWSNVAGGPTSSTGNSVLSPQVRQGQFRR